MAVLAKGPTAKRRQSKARAKARLLAIADETVMIRDMARCRVCQRPGLHAHHIIFRSLGGKDTTDNLCLLCAQCHDDIHQHRVTVTGNANGQLQIERIA